MLPAGIEDWVIDEGLTCCTRITIKLKDRMVAGNGVLLFTTEASDDDFVE